MATASRSTTGTSTAGTARRKAATTTRASSARSPDMRVLKREIAATMKELQAIEGEIAKVVRRMVSQTLETALAKVSTQEPVLVARDIGGLVLQAVQQVLRGTAEGLEQVMKSHRSARKAAAKRAPARRNGARAGSRTSG